MRFISSRFESAVRTSHRVHVHTEVWHAGAWTPINIQSGSVTVNLSSATARSLSLTLAPGDISPDGTRIDFANLNIYSSFIRVYRGVVYPDNVVERVPLGTFVVDSVKLAHGNDGESIEVSGSDLYTLVERANLINPWTLRLASGPTRTYANAIRTVIQSALEPQRFSFLQGSAVPVTSTVTEKNDNFPAAYTIERSRTDFIKSSLKAIRAIGYFDGNNTYVIRDNPEVIVPQSVSWEATTGDTGVLLSVSLDFSREEVYNVVKASTGSSSDNTKETIYTSTAVDNDPASPTYWKGPFGYAVKHISNSAWNTQALVDYAARAELRDSLKLSKKVDMSFIPNPALEPGDRIRVYFTRGASETFLVTSMTYPLNVTESMSASCTRLDTGDGEA